MSLLVKHCEKSRDKRLQTLLGELNRPGNELVAQINGICARKAVHPDMTEAVRLTLKLGPEDDVGPLQARQAAMLVLLALLPVAWGAGAFYLACAVAGGAYFLYRSILLVREPTQKNAIRNFLASLLQLTLLLVGAIVDGAVAGRLVTY